MAARLLSLHLSLPDHPARAAARSITQRRSAADTPLPAPAAAGRCRTGEPESERRGRLTAASVAAGVDDDCGHRRLLESGVLQRAWPLSREAGATTNCRARGGRRHGAVHRDEYMSRQVVRAQQVSICGSVPPPCPSTRDPSGFKCELEVAEDSRAESRLAEIHERVARRRVRSTREIVESWRRSLRPKITARRISPPEHEAIVAAAGRARPESLGHVLDLVGRLRALRAWGESASSTSVA